VKCSRAGVLPSEYGAPPINAKPLALGRYSPFPIQFPEGRVKDGSPWGRHPLMTGCATRYPKRILRRVRHLWPIHAPVVLILSVLVAACNDADGQRREEIAGRLAGTWLEESESDGLTIRRVVTLKKGGTFEQAVKVLEPGGSVRSEVAAGDWYFDGETFKRRYRTVDGKQLSGIQFASYQVISLTDSELACVDHLTEGKRNVRFRRVADGTTP